MPIASSIRPPLRLAPSAALVPRLGWAPFLFVSIACGCSDHAAPRSTPLADLASNVAISLETCGGTAESNVPAFYRTYFHCADIRLSADAASVVITTNDLPPHPSPYYPSAHPNYVAYSTDRAGSTLCTGGQMPSVASGCYAKNPNTIAQNSVTLTIPLEPLANGLDVNANAAMIDHTSGDANDYALGPVGVSLDGVSLFSAFAAPGDMIENEAYTFDSWEAHPTGLGQYHYHRWAPGPLAALQASGIASSAVPGSPAAGDVEVYGIMCDGTLVLGATELDGSAPTGALDAQGGHSHAIVDGDGVMHFGSRYHAHISPNAIAGNSTAYPFVPELRFYSTCDVARN